MSLPSQIPSAEHLFPPVTIVITTANTHQHPPHQPTTNPPPHRHPPRKPQNQSSAIPPTTLTNPRTPYPHNPPTCNSTTMHDHHDPQLTYLRLQAQPSSGSPPPPCTTITVLSRLSSGGRYCSCSCHHPGHTSWQKNEDVKHRLKSKMVTPDYSRKLVLRIQNSVFLCIACTMRLKPRHANQGFTNACSPAPKHERGPML